MYHYSRSLIGVICKRGITRPLSRCTHTSSFSPLSLAGSGFVDKTPQAEKEQVQKNIQDIAANKKKAQWSISKTFRFEAAHRLFHHDGKCAKDHGHSYVCTVELRGNSLFQDGPKKAMVIDFTDISKNVKPLIESHLDHWHLNETLETDSPTAEYIAMWIYYKLKPKLPNLHAITINETESSSVRFCEVE